MRGKQAKKLKIFLKYGSILPHMASLPWRGYRKVREFPDRREVSVPPLW
jgi:hypothetical protein